MNKIEIRNFGPVKMAEIDLNKHNQVFIGPQASGKSTICKVVIQKKYKGNVKIAARELKEKDNELDKI